MWSNKYHFFLVMWHNFSAMITPHLGQNACYSEPSPLRIPNLTKSNLRPPFVHNYLFDENTRHLLIFEHLYTFCHLPIVRNSSYCERNLFCIINIRREITVELGLPGFVGEQIFYIIGTQRLSPLSIYYCPHNKSSRSDKWIQLATV